jgi:glyoxylase I family protein
MTMSKTNQTLGGGGFHHVAIRARDFDASVHFYTQALGFVEKIRWGEGDKRAIMLDVGDGNYLEIFAGRNESLPTTAAEPPILHFAIRTTNTDAAVARARSAGAVVTTEPKDVVIKSAPQPTPVRLAFCKGPDGEIIEFFQNETT